MIPLAKGAQRAIQDFLLTRYACYLIAQNGDPKKEEIAFAQSKHPIKYITKTTKAAIPIVGYAAFVIYSHSFFHLCGSSCSCSSSVAFCIYGILFFPLSCIPNHLFFPL
jgi:hypothetical protein